VVEFKAELVPGAFYNPAAASRRIPSDIEIFGS
jgi:hypothetical protein